MGSQSSASASGGHASETVLSFAPTASLRKHEPQSSEVDLDQRIGRLSRAIQLNPRDPKAYRSRGLLQARKEAYDAAISDFNNAVSLNPKDATSHAFRAIIWQRKNNRERAKPPKRRCPVPAQCRLRSSGSAARPPGLALRSFAQRSRARQCPRPMCSMTNVPSVSRPYAGVPAHSRSLPSVVAQMPASSGCGGRRQPLIMCAQLCAPVGIS